MSKKNKDRNLVEKVDKLKERQDRWMNERAESKQSASKKFVHSSLKSNDSTTTYHHQKKSSQQDAVKKEEAVVWTTNSSSKYNGFVVRNGSGSSRNQPNSNRTPSTKSTKMFTHTSLKKEKSSRPVSAQSTNFKLSKQGVEDVGENDNSDESLSASFTEHMSNLKFKAYDEEKYSRADLKTENSTKTKYMLNHSCPGCKQVMIEIDRKPQMVFPCGHSFCAKCLNGKPRCLDCNCEIISYQTNESLLAVIQQFKQKQDREELEMKEKQARRFIDEYNNFNSRIGILKGIS